MQKEQKTIPLSKLMLNKGQIEWLPKNPRQWTKNQMALMIKSLDEDPDFMEDRPPLVVPLPEDERGRFIVFAGYSGRGRETAAAFWAYSAILHPRPPLFLPQPGGALRQSQSPDIPAGRSGSNSPSAAAAPGGRS